MFSGDARQDTWEFNGTNWTQVVTLVNPTGRNFHRLVYDAARQAGIDSASISLSTEEK